jgi:hypothetical protein
LIRKALNTNIFQKLPIMKNTYKDYTKRLCTDSTNIATSKLPEQLRDVLENYLFLGCEGVPKEVVLLNFLSKVAQILCHFRINIKTSLMSTDTKTVFPNIYGLVFMPSGEGKDFVGVFIDKTLMKPFYDKFDSDVNAYKERRYREIEEKAITIEDKKARAEYERKAKSEVRIPTPVFSDCTPEGLIFLREAFKNAGFGGTYLKQSEFADYITTQNYARLESLSIIKDIYEFGDSNPKIIKNEVQFSSIRGVPSNAMFNTSLSGLFTSQYKSTVADFFNRGFGRRAFVLCPHIETPDIEGIDLEMIAKQKILEKQELSVRDEGKYIGKIQHLLATLIQNSSYVLSKEADILLYIYKKINRYRASKVIGAENEALHAEIKTRDTKVLRLAGVLSIFENPSSTEIDVRFVEQAIYITEVFGNQFANMITAQLGSDSDRLFNYLFQNLNKWISTGELRSQYFVNKDYFKQWLESVKEYIDEKATNEGLVFEERKLIRNGTNYRLTKLRDTNLDEISISVTIKEIPDFDGSKATKFDHKIVSFQDIPKFANSKFGYSNLWWNSNYRKTENYIPEVNLIILDIDGNWALEEAKKFIKEKGITALITTTKSHQKEKNGTVSDRFRIFIPLSNVFSGTSDEYTKLLGVINDEFLDKKADVKAFDGAHFYFGNPEGEVWLHEGKLFDVVEYIYKVVHLRCLP